MELKRRILVVDDEPSVTRQIKRNLELTNEFVVEEENLAVHAISTALKFKPDLIILDVMMPDVDGGTLASQFKESKSFRDVPIVFLTAAVTKGEAMHLHFQNAGNRLLAKPVGAAVLINCLREELAKATAPDLSQLPMRTSLPDMPASGSRSDRG